MPIIAVANHKGGVGKTAIAVHLAWAIAQTGQDVLLIDTDRQGDACIWLGLPSEARARGFAEALVGKGLKRYFLRSQHPTLYVLPPGQAQLPFGLQLEMAVALRSELKQMFKWVILDTPPYWSVPQLNALALADSVLCPVNLGAASLRGQKDLRSQVAAIPQALRPRVDFITPNMVDARMKRLAARVLEPLRTARVEELTPIVPVSSLVQISYLENTTVFSLDPSSKIAIAYQAVADHVINTLEAANGKR